MSTVMVVATPGEVFRLYRIHDPGAETYMLEVGRWQELGESSVFHSTVSLLIDGVQLRDLLQLLAPMVSGEEPPSDLGGVQVAP